MTAAHVAGIPLEELLPLAYGSVAVWAASLRAVRVRRPRRR